MTHDDRCDFRTGVTNQAGCSIKALLPLEVFLKCDGPSTSKSQNC